MLLAGQQETHLTYKDLVFFPKFTSDDNIVVATRFFVKLGKVKVGLLDSGQKITE